MAEPQSISLLLPSRGRLEGLRTAVGSMYSAIPPPCAVELVMVSSGSSETADAMRVLAQQAPSWITVKLLDADLPGKCRALNLGLPACNGRYLIFTDDDVRVSPDYFHQVLRGFAETGADGLQGRVRLTLEGQRPIWFTDHCAALMAATSYLDREAPSLLTSLNSCNMAVTLEAARAAGPFSEVLGPGAPRFPLGDDTEWSMRMARQGRRLVYWPGMTVEHRVSVQRATLGYLAHRSYLSGLFQAAVGANRPVPLAFASLRRVAIDGVRSVENCIRGRHGLAADRFLQVARHIGVLIGLLGRSRGHPLWTTPGQLASFR